MLWNWIVRPILFTLPAETAHHFSMRSFSLLARLPGVRQTFGACFSRQDPRLKVNLFGIDFDNPVGLAAGFDKNAEWFDILPSLGFGHIEVGTVTGEGQPGNDRPRLFRLKQDKALLNRMGFNNHGCDVAARSIARRTKRSVIGINIGKTKKVELESAEADYLKSFSTLYAYADYFTVNVSSPNTPGLRELQGRDHLTRLLSSLSRENARIAESKNSEPLPILLKIAPDLTPEQLDEVVQISLENKLSGIIATNTTVSREGLVTPSNKVDALGNGGISGKPLTERSRDFVKQIFQRTEGKLPVIGVGGIMNGEDAWQMICSGASLIQVYSGFIYHGPGFVKSINNYLLKQLDSAGLDSIDQAIGRSI